jgi:hypothetical protein
VFDHVITALVHGSGYKRLASPDCSDRKSALEKKIDELRVFEREYRTCLKAYLNSQLRELRARIRRTSRPGGRAQHLMRLSHVMPVDDVTAVADARHAEYHIIGTTGRQRP